MPICETHAHYYPEGWYCKECKLTGTAKEKKEVKHSIENLIESVQRKFSAAMKKTFIVVKGKVDCCTCGEKISASKSGIWGIHWGHLYDKAIYWLFMFDPRNGGPQCYNCNVNLNGNKEKLEKYVKTKLGKDWKQFQQEVEGFKIDLNKGIQPKTPTLEFLKQFSNGTF